MRKAAGNAFERVRESDGRNEGEERGGEAQVHAGSRGRIRNAADGLRPDGRPAKPEGISGGSAITMRNSLSALGDGKGEEGTVQAGNENRSSFTETTLAAAKYESAALRPLSVPDYQISGNTDEFINEIVRQFTLVARKGGGEARISLRPDFLGGMKLNLRLENGEVSSFILVDNPAVKDLIMSRLTVLEQGLLQHGLSLGSFQVAVKDGGSRAQAEGQDGDKRAGAAIETGLVEDASENAPLAGAGLPWISTVVDITV
jgi:flagellar hook-length control protein FliK